MTPASSRLHKRQNSDNTFNSVNGCAAKVLCTANIRLAVCHCFSVVFHFLTLFSSIYKSSTIHHAHVLLLLICKYASSEGSEEFGNVSDEKGQKQGLFSQSSILLH